MNNIYNLDANEFFNYLIENDIKSDLQIQDPPYEVSVPNGDIKFNNKVELKRDFAEWDYIDLDIITFCENISKTSKEDSNVLVFYNNYSKISSMVSEFNKYFDKVDILVWSKTNPKPQIRKRSFTQCHELMVYARRGKYTFNFPEHAESFSNYTLYQEGDEALDSTIYHPLCQGRKRLKNENGTIHPTQKPFTLLQHYISILSNPKDLIIDSYAGVLTTAYAAKTLNRNFIVNEINIDYLNAGTEWINSLEPELEFVN